MKLWIVIYAIGAAQSALLALALWRRPADPAANRLLAAWLALVGLDLAIKSWFLAAPAVELFKAYRFVALFPFLYGSLFYLYVRALTTGRRFAARDTVHLAGFALALATTAGTFLLDAETVSAAFARHQAGDWPPPGWWYDPFLFVYSLSYVIAAVVRLHRYRQWLRQRRSNVDRLSLRWIEALAIAQLLIWCIAATHWLIRWPWIDYFLIYGAVAAWVCMIGWFSLGQPPVAEAAQAPPDASADEPAATAGDPRFPEVEARLMRLMEDDALYREPALTIGQVARRSGYPEYLVSAVINRRLGGNFWEWINRQRIDAARRSLADPADQRTILDIAYACGFTSKSTFNAAFKRVLHETPSAWRRRSARAAQASAGSARRPPG